MSRAPKATPKPKTASKSVSTTSKSKSRSKSLESAATAPLTFHGIALPDGEPWPEPWRSQVGPLLEQALGDGPDGVGLLTRLEIHAEGGHLYDLTLFVDEDGTVYRRGTTDRVASFSQGEATGSTDEGLLAALNRARDEWLRTRRARAAAPHPRPPTQPRASATPIDVPRYATTYDRLALGGRLPSSLRSARLAMERPPAPGELEALRAWLPERAADVIVEIAAKVPLEVLRELGGVRFVVLGPGRRDWRGLSHLPRSVRRLSIRKATEVSLGELPEDAALTSLELDTPRVLEGAPELAGLETLAWTGAEELGWVARLPHVRELALRRSKVAALPQARAVERLLVFSPSGLASLVGLETMPRLRYLRIDDPKGMARLGDLSRCCALETIHLGAAHRIGDLADLVTPPALRTLGTSQTQLDPAPFLPLVGKLTGAALQLKSSAHSKAIAAHLGVPFVKTLELESHLFDER
jgi:hypothetical protein